MPFSQEKSIENNSKRILTHILRHWNECTPILHPSTNEFTPQEHAELKTFPLKLNSIVYPS